MPDMQNLPLYIYNINPTCRNDCFHNNHGISSPFLPSRRIFAMLKHAPGFFSILQKNKQAPMMRIFFLAIVFFLQYCSNDQFEFFFCFVFKKSFLFVLPFEMKEYSYFWCLYSFITVTFSQLFFQLFKNKTPYLFFKYLYLFI